MMINRMLRIMWPKLTESIFKTVIGVVKPMIQDMLNKVSTQHSATAAAAAGACARAFNS
jgi:hypothetical protein